MSTCCGAVSTDSTRKWRAWASRFRWTMRCCAASPTRSLQQIARPAEIDRGGNVRGNVDGAATKPNDIGETDGNNWVLDGWITLAAVDATVYRLCRSVLLRTNSSGFQKYLGPGSHSALLANKRFARQDRRRRARARSGGNAVSRPRTVDAICAFRTGRSAHRARPRGLRRYARRATG